MKQFEPNTKVFYTIEFLSILLISTYIIIQQLPYDFNIRPDALKWLEIQVDRHKLMMEGKIYFFNPWQYRVFSMWVVEFFIQLSQLFTDNPKYALVFLRLVQNITIFYVFKYYLKALNIKSPFLVLCGIMLLGYSMANSIYDSDLSYNTYFNILFYLLAGLIALKKIPPVAIIPLTICAAFNRESSGFIPLMIIFCSLEFKPLKIRDKSGVYCSLISLVIFFVIFLGVRVHYGFAERTPVNNCLTIIDYLKYNILRPQSLIEVFGTLGFIPLVTVPFLKFWPKVLRIFFWLIIPTWLIVHSTSSLLEESRLLLVPNSLVFIPALLHLAKNYSANKTQTKFDFC